MRLILIATVAMASTLWLRDLPPPVTVWLAAGGGLLMLGVSAIRPLGVAVCAACWVLLAADARLSKTLPGRDAVEALCVGEVVGLPLVAENRMRFQFRVEHCDNAPGRFVPPGLLARITWYRDPLAMAPGDRLRVRLALRPPRGRSNPHGFDFDTWLFVRGIGALGSVRSDPANRILERGELSLDRLRWQLRERLRAAANGLPNAGLIEALVVGSRDRITPEHRALLARTGAAHLVAISGLHIGMVASVGAGLAWAMWWVVVRRRDGVTVALDRRVCATLVGLALATAYAALAGFSLPTVRALLMLLVFSLALICRVSLQPGQSLSVAFAVVLVIWPLSLLDAGFWLSFAAVLAIACGLRVRRHWSGLWQGLWVNAVIGVVLTPLTVLVFGDITWLSPFANLMLVPVFAFLVVPVVLLAAALLGLAPLWATALFGIADAVLSVLLKVLSLVAGAVPLGMPSVLHAPAIVALLVVSVLLLLPRTWPLSMLCVCASVAIAFGGGQARPAHGSVRVTVLDVGHGLAVVLETAKHTLVYDAGPRYGQFDTGAMVVAPVVRAGGRERVDALVVSHADSDHAGGVPGLLNSVPVARVYRPENGSCLPGTQWHWDGVTFTVEHPAKGFVGSENDASCVLRVRVDSGQSVLLLGDVERRGEAAMVRRGISAADVILVPHHGSKTSSGPALLAQLKPALAVVSHARGGRFDLPHPSVIERYAEHGIPLVGTADHGAIRFQLPTDGPVADSLMSWRLAHRRFWHPP